MKFNIAGKIVEVADADITKAIEDKTEEISVKTDLVIRDIAEEKTYKQNLLSEGKTTGVEMAVKEVKRELGLEFTGKDIKDLAKAAGEKAVAEANLNPDEAVKKLNADIVILKKTVETLENEKTTIVTEHNGFKNTIAINRAIEAGLPENLALPKEDIRELLKMKMKFDVDEKGEVVVKDNDGNVIKDNTASPKSSKLILDDFFRDHQQYLTGVKGGNGGKDSGGGSGKKQKLEDWMKEREAENVHPNSTEFNEKLAAAQKAGEVDLD